jgi:hypothetical protein
MKVANYGKDLTVYFYVKKLSNLNINKLDRLFYEYKQD